MVEIEITTPIPTTNKYLRMHYHLRKKLKSALCNELASLLLEDSVLYSYVLAPGQKEFRAIEIIGYRRRFQDKVNFENSFKPLLDALKHVRLIYDDSMTWLADSYRQEKGMLDRTVVQIFDLPADLSVIKAKQ